MRTLEEIMPGWRVEERTWGVFTTMGARGRVPGRGKWLVVGGYYGGFVVVRPNGWAEQNPRFETQVEAMAWVDDKFAKGLQETELDPDERPEVA